MKKSEEKTMLNIAELLKVICNEIELNEWKDEHIHSDKQK